MLLVKVRSLKVKVPVVVRRVALVLVLKMQPVTRAILAVEVATKA